MASGNADLYTAQRLAGGFPPSQVDATIGSNGDFGSRIDDSKRTEAPLEYADAIYTTLGTEADTEVISLFYLPIGAVVYPEHSFLFNETDPGTTLALDIGDVTDPDRYADGIAGAAAGRVEFTSAVANVAGVVTRHEVTETTRLVRATVAGATSTLSAGVKMHFKIAYKVLQP